MVKNIYLRQAITRRKREGFQKPEFRNDVIQGQPLKPIFIPLIPRNPNSFIHWQFTQNNFPSRFSLHPWMKKQAKTIVSNIWFSRLRQSQQQSFYSRLKSIANKKRLNFFFSSTKAIFSKLKANLITIPLFSKQLTLISFA